MGQRIAILTFSGTGNTAAVAAMIRDDLRLAGETVDEYRIEDLLDKKQEFTAADFDLVGIGYPSYGFNVPSVVAEYAKTLRGNGRCGAFLFMTCAGPCYINDIASYSLKRLLVKQGFSIVYESVIVMPANILIPYRDELVKQLYQAAQKRAHTMAADLSAGRPCVRKDGFFARLLRWGYVWCEGPMLRFLALDFKVSKACTRCRKCVDNCPRHNISLKNGRIRFGARCAACYRCVYGCPQRAITGRLYNVLILKKMYDLDRVVRDDAIGNIFVTKDTKGIFKTLQKYLDES